MARRNLLALILASLMLDVMVCRASFAGGDSAGSPFTSLFDTSVPQESPLPADGLATKKGWAAVAADTVAHTFAGDAVFMNDRVAVVMRRGAGRADVYSKSPGAWRQRATLFPLAADGGTGLASLRIIENSQTAVILEATINSKAGATATYQFRLTAGDPLLEVRGGKGAGRVRICDQAQYVVVPDFFADDMVFDPAAHESARIGLPTENSLLGLSDDGNAIVACVWRSARQNVDLLLAGEGAGRKVSGYEIDLPADNRLWIAAMEGPGIWHARRMTEQKPNDEVALDWKPPIPARWRTDFVSDDGMSLSTYFADPQAGLEPENSRSNAACRFDAGRAVVRMIDPVAAVSPHLVVTYPVERTRATPLTAFCVIDLIRNALGVGPCQYVLDAEGLGDSDSPTPDQVTHWVEKQLEKKASKRDANAIRKKLAMMSVQVKRTDARIGEYTGFAEKMKQTCADYGKTPDHAAAAGRLAAIVQRVTIAPAPALPIVDKLASDVVAQADQDDALAKCQPSLSAIRSAGAAQDYALAKLRMAARRMKQESRMLAGADPASVAFAGQIQQQAEQMLVGK